METKFNSQICTSIKQSSMLLALGLKKETADMYYPPFYFENNLIDYFDAKVLGGSVREEMMAGYEEYKDYIPAWSLHRLASMIEEDFQSDGRFFCLPMFGFDKSDNLYDNIIDAYAWLIKEGYFNKEYLV